jgi:hypothetical protein
MDTDPPKGLGPSSPEEERSRGRRRSRELETDGDTKMTDGDEKDDSITGPGRTRKRRRSRKGLDKKFECGHEDCTKSYSRAEHLHRHQLNRKFINLLNKEQPT